MEMDTILLEGGHLPVSLFEIVWKTLLTLAPLLYAAVLIPSRRASQILPVLHVHQQLLKQDQGLVSQCPPNTLAFSSVFSDGVVLQRRVASRVWGWAGVGCSTVVTLVDSEGGVVWGVTEHDGTGYWVATFPPREASILPATLVATTSGGDVAQVEGVVFGEVLVCAGQSNIAGHPLDGTIGPADVAVALSVVEVEEQGGSSGAGGGVRHGMETRPLPVRYLMVNKSAYWYVGEERVDLDAPPLFPWLDASLLNPAVEALSGVCWLGGREVAEGLGGSVPVGLVEVAVGGSFIQGWSSKQGIGECGAPPVPNDYATWAQGGFGGLRNGLLAPFFKGPMAVGGVVWYNGESNALALQHDYYACALPRFMKDLREGFAPAPASAAVASPPPPSNLWIGVVELHPFIIYDTTRVPTAAIRAVQLKATLTSPPASLIPAVDMGDPLSPYNNLHPRNKLGVGQRLGRAYLGHLGVQPFSGGPRYLSAKAVPPAAGSSSGGGGVVCMGVEVEFVEGSVGGGGLTLRPHSMASVSTRCPEAEGIEASFCEWFSVQDSGGGWHNASGVEVVGGKTLRLSVFQGGGCTPGVTLPIATRFGYNSWPVVLLYDLSGLPTHPWEATPLSATATSPRVN